MLRGLARYAELHGMYVQYDDTQCQDRAEDFNYNKSSNQPSSCRFHNDLIIEHGLCKHVLAVEHSRGQIFCVFAIEELMIF